MADIGEAVEGALRDAFTEVGAMVTGFTTVVTYIHNDGSAMFLVLKPEGQSIMQTTGMIEVARMYNMEAVMDSKGQP